jgi:hypothetical protein
MIYFVIYLDLCVWCVHMHICPPVSVCVHACLSLCMSLYILVWVWVCIHMSLCVSVYMCAHVFVFVCVLMSVCLPLPLSIVSPPSLSPPFLEFYSLVPNQ